MVNFVVEFTIDLSDFVKNFGVDLPSLRLQQNWSTIAAFDTTTLSVGVFTQKEDGYGFDTSNDLASGEFFINIGAGNEAFTWDMLKGQSFSASASAETEFRKFADIGLKYSQSYPGGLEEGMFNFATDSAALAFGVETGNPVMHEIGMSLGVGGEVLLDQVKGGVKGGRGRSLDFEVDLLETNTRPGPSFLQGNLNFWGAGVDPGASGGFVLYPNKINSNITKEVFIK